MTDVQRIVITARNLIQARAGGKVERCHGIPHAGSYSNAAHQHGVALLMFYLWPEDFPRLAIYCLTHDTPEFIFGDIPAPVARYAPGLRATLGRMETRYCELIGLPAEGDLPEEDHRKLKACDALEFYLWCREQQAQGNTFANEALAEVVQYFGERPLPDRAEEFLQYCECNSILPTQAGVAKRIAGETEK